MTEGSRERFLLLVAREVVTLDPTRPRARAVAVRHGRIARAGTVEEAREALPGGAPEIDLGDAVLLPGFHDAHTHLSAGAVELSSLDLREARSAEEVASSVAATARQRPQGSWIRGFGWDASRFEDGSRPTREALDHAAPENPVVLGRADGHAVWLNTRALAEIGGNESDRDGLLREEEAEKARARVPPVADAERRAAVVRALSAARRLGLTSVEDVVEPWALPLYLELLEGGGLPVRLGLWLPLEMDDVEADAWRGRFAPGNAWVSCTVRKAFLDGTLAGRSAALSAPYADAPGTMGTLRVDPGTIAPRLAEAARGGWAIALHAVGDLAVRTALDLLSDLPAPASGGRHRVEHAQVVAEADLPRFAALGAAASLQPAHWLGDRRFVEARLGARRGVRFHPWRSLVSAGAEVAFGSDWPVAPLDPRRTLAAALSREREGERLDPLTAIEAQVAGPARLAGDRRRGAIREGARADLVAVRTAGDADLRSPEAWSVLSTWVGGEV